MRSMLFAALLSAFVPFAALAQTADDLKKRISKIDGDGPERPVFAAHLGSAPGLEPCLIHLDIFRLR